MSGQIPGRKRPAGPAEDQTTKKARLVAPTQQTQVPVPGPEEELTGDISDDPADKTVVLKAGPGTSDPSASTTAMVLDPVLVSTTTATSATDLATPFLMLLPPQWGAADAEIKVPSEPRGGLVKNTELVGASPSFRYPMYYYKEGQQDSATGDAGTVQESGEIKNQLQKSIRFERELLQIFGHIADHKPVCVWMSDTLNWDLNLPVTTPLPFLPGFLQAFVICVGRPPFLVSLYSKGDDSDAVEAYGSDTARLLHWSLLDFCHLNFSVLPVNAELDAFLSGTVDLGKEVDAKVQVVKRYIKRPLKLNDDTFAGLRAATTALVGATFVPCLLKDEPRDRMWLLLMSKEWRNAVSQVIEMLNRKGRFKLTYSPTMPTSATVVVALEAAKRVSFTREIQVTCMTDEVQICLQRLEQHVQDKLDIPLGLTCQRVDSPEGQDEMTILLEDTTERRLQEMYGLISDGRLSELCQHPSLGHHAFLDDLQDFCSRQKHEEQFLLRALDKEHGLPLLYWSLWSHSTHLTQWCLTKMKELVDSGGVLSESLLSAALATMFIAASDDSLTVNAKEFLKKLTCMQFQHGAKDTLKLALPYPKPFETEKGNIRYTEIKTRLQSPGVCYLNDPSLPIPATLLSVTSTEDAVSVELSSRHWYLVLSLLADREVDETDDNDNTVLHIAADTGDLQAITLAMKSGASLVVKNNEGLTPCQLAQRRWMKPEETCTIRHDHIPSRDLQAACREGDIETVNTALLQSASVRHREGQNGNTPLHTACERGHKDIASLLILLCAEIDEQNEEGFTPLHLACKWGHTETAGLLLDHHADVNAKNSAGFTPLHLAVESGHGNTAGLLIERGAEIDIKTKDGFTPLHFACMSGLTETAELLMDRGAEVDVGSRRDLRPLHLACRFGRLGVVQLLLEYGTDVNVAESYGFTPLHDASVKGQRDISVALIENHAEVNARTSYGLTALHLASHNGRVDIVRVLIEHNAFIDSKCNSGETALHLACKNRHVDVVSLLLKHRADVNLEDSDGRTALYEACSVGRADIVGLLPEDVHNADVTVQDENGSTALHEACSQGDADVVSLLLSRYDDVNIVDYDGYTAFLLACRGQERGHPKIVHMLLEQDKIDVSVKNNDGRTALHLASAFGHVDSLRHLLDRDTANVNVQDNMGRTALHLASIHDNLSSLRLLLNCDIADVNVLENDGRTALHLASMFGHAKSVEQLLSCDNVDVNVKDKYGHTALHLASAKGHADSLRHLLNSDIADVNALDNDGRTPLHLASIDGHAKSVEQLLGCDKADANAKDKDGYTALHLASAKGHADSLRQLLSCAGVDINVQDNLRRTALHLASICGQAKSLEQLLSCGKADVNAKDKYGRTALHLASAFGFADSLKQLLNCGTADVNAQDNEGRTALQVAGICGQAESVKQLLSCGKADVNAKDNYDYTYLELARACGQADS